MFPYSKSLLPLLIYPRRQTFWAFGAWQVFNSDTGCTQMRLNQALMVPTGRLVKVSFYIIDLRVMSVFPLSPLLSICACTQLALWQGYSHLPYMLRDLRSGNRALDSHPCHCCTFFIPQNIRIFSCANTILKLSESSQSNLCFSRICDEENCELGECKGKRASFSHAIDTSIRSV